MLHHRRQRVLQAQAIILSMKLDGPGGSRSHGRGLLLLVLGLLAILPAASLAGPSGSGKPIAPGRADLRPLDQVEHWISPPVDEAQLLREDAALSGKDDAPYRIGFPMTVDIATTKGTWEDLSEGGRVWRIVAQSDGA